MNIRKATITAALLLTAGAPSVNAQGSVQFRYAQLPSQLAYTTADTMSSFMAGGPMGGMETRITLSGRTDLTFEAAAGDSTKAVLTMSDMSGQMSAMGQSMEVPIPPEMMQPVEVMLAPDGEVRYISGATIAGVPGNQNMAATISRMFPRIPAEALAPGGTWTDSMTQSIDSAGMKANVRGIIHGTFAGDTTVDGKRLHVLRYDVDQTVDVSGNMQGMQMTQSLTGRTTTIALYDPARRIMTYLREETVMSGKVDAPAAGMQNADIEQKMVRVTRVVE